MKKRSNTRGQIWVETVIYTLIAFAMIGLALAFIKPKIDEIQDKAIIEQSLSVLEEMNSVIEELSLKDPGNQRRISVGLRQGTLNIDGNQDKLLFELEGGYAYSEPTVEITVGNIDVLTEQFGEVYTVTLSKAYESYDLTVGENSEDVEEILSQSSNPYEILLSRENNNAQNEPVINLEVIN